MASKNIVAKGTTYNGVESVTFPTSPSGTATFFEVSDTTATASDVLNSKYFYTAAGVKTQGTGAAPSPTLITKSITANGTYDAEDDDADGYSSVTVSVSGGGGDSWNWMGKNPTKVKDVTTVKKYLKDTGYATWEPSTTAAIIVSSSTLTSESISMADYDYYIIGRFHSHLEYGSGAVAAAQANDWYFTTAWTFAGVSTNLTNITNDTSNNSMNTSLSTLCRYGLFYKNTSGNDAFGANTYGIYMLTNSAIVSNSTNSSTATFTPQIPDIYARCNNSYFSTTNAAAVDQNTSYYEFVIELWRVDKRTSIGGGITKSIRDMWLNGF